jgi:hypothetical protein
MERDKVKGYVKPAALTVALAAIFGAAALIGGGLAADVTANATAGNVAPTVDTLSVTPGTTISPGTTFYVAATINDANGQADLSTVNVSCIGTGGTQWTDGWDSIKRTNASQTWTSVNTSAWTVNTTFSSSANYWGTKSINGTWTCNVYANDASSAIGSSTGTMTVGTSVGISTLASTCAFTSGSPGDTDKQWGCPTSAGGANNTVQHDGNIGISVTISGTALTGVTDNSWTIGVGNITWNQTTGPVPSTEAGTALSATATSFITAWTRGASTTSNMTNATAWVDYPNPLKVQTYQGTMTLTSSAQ